MKAGKPSRKSSRLLDVFSEHRSVCSDSMLADSVQLADPEGLLNTLLSLLQSILTPTSDKSDPSFNIAIHFMGERDRERQRGRQTDRQIDWQTDKGHREEVSDRLTGRPTRDIERKCQTD